MTLQERWIIDAVSYDWSVSSFKTYPLVFDIRFDIQDWANFISGVIKSSDINSYINYLVEKHKELCLFGGSFDIPFGESLVIPSDESDIIEFINQIDSDLKESLSVST